MRMLPQPAAPGVDGAKVLRRVALMRRVFTMLAQCHSDAAVATRMAQVLEYVHKRNVVTFGHLVAEGIRASAYLDALETPLPVADAWPGTLADFEDSLRGGL